MQLMTQSAIQWPENYLPGETDNFCSNEVIVKNGDLHRLWQLLSQPHLWPSYYANSANVKFDGETLFEGAQFYFETFGFPVYAECVEFVAPTATRAGRIAWHGWAGEVGTAERLDVHHAWLLENLPHNRVRILTQETQIGEPAKALAVANPNPMINGHQDWLNGLVKAAAER